MLGDVSIEVTLSVNDLEAARKFYEGILGLHKLEEDSGGIMFQSGNCKAYVYLSDFSGTNQATAAAWEVQDLDAVISELKAKGVTFEHYDSIPGASREGDIHVIDDEKVAWFKDPFGNILALASTPKSGT